MRRRPTPRCWCESAPLGAKHNLEHLIKSISKNGGRSSYRGMLQVTPKAAGCRSKVVCDALMLDEDSRSDTYPTMEIGNSTADLEHEASVSKVSGDQLFYLMSRGHTEEEAMGMIVNGFFEPLPESSLWNMPLNSTVSLNWKWRARLDDIVPRCHRSKSIRTPLALHAMVKGPSRRC